MKQFISLIIIGDLHSKWNVIIDFIKKFQIANTCFFQVGDFGIGFKEDDLERLVDLNTELYNSNNALYIIRGNHDNPKYFDGSFNYFSNINFLSDYSITSLIIDDKEINVLGIGGAISSDRYKREVNIGYWENESIVFDFNHPVLNKNIDILITHNGPDFVQPYLTNIINEEMKEDHVESIKTERNKLSQLVDVIIENNPNLKHSFYGHFHFSNQSEYKNVQFNLLGINEFKEVRL